MFFALLVAISSVTLGAALSFVPGTSRGVLGYMRTFATVSALAVVITHLLPEALRAFGPISILLFLAGWFTPALAHSIGQRSTQGRPAHAVLEAGYWGLVVHHVADGVGLGTYTRLPASDGSHLDVIVALAAHTVPLIAVVSLAYRTTFGTRSALLRSLGLALAIVVGIGLSSLVGADTVERFAPVIAAVAAGLLLHVVTHDLTEDPPLGALSRTLDLGVAALGVGVSVLGVERNSDPATWQFAAHLVRLTGRSSVVVLLGLALAALMLRVRNADAKWTRAALPAGPLGPESVLLGLSLFGFGSTGLRVLAAVCVVALWGNGAPWEPVEPPPRTWVARLCEALARLGPWLVLGLLVGALLASVSPSAFTERWSNSIPELILIACVANVTPVAAPAAVLIATGLRTLGLSSGAVLLFAMLSPVLAGRALTVRQRVPVTLACGVVGWFVNHVHLAATPLDGSLPGGASAWLFGALLATLLLFGVWQRGARIWLSSIVRTPEHEHEHAHDVHGPHEH